MARVIYGGTASDEKDHYKALMQTAKGQFYKRQSNDAPPAIRSPSRPQTHEPSAATS